MSIALWQELQDLKRRVEELEAINAKRVAEDAEFRKLYQQAMDNLRMVSVPETDRAKRRA